MDERAVANKRQTMRGVSVVELIVVMAVIAILSTVAVMGITRARNSVKLQNSARVLAGYLEKARVDAVRRHDGTNVDITGPNTYTVTMDFDGRGSVVERTFTLERGVVFTDSTNTPYTISGDGSAASSTGEAVSWGDFNWRGRTSQCSMMFRLQNSNNERSVVQLAGSGDITIDSVITSPATATTTTVSPSSDVVSSSVVTGAGAHPELNPCSVSSSSGGPSSGPIAPPVASCPGGTISASAGSISVRKNGAAATVNITVTGPGTISTTANSNLQVTPATREVTSTSGGTFAFTIKSITRLRASNPPFIVQFRNPCSSITIYVTVTN